MASAVPGTTLPSRIARFSPNKLKLGLFGSNCSSGRAATTVPERWPARVGRQPALGADGRCGRHRFHAADRALEAAMAARPISRASTLETVTWACGLLAADRALDRLRHGARAAGSSGLSRPSSSSPPITSAKAASVSTSSAAGTKTSSTCSAPSSASMTIAMNTAPNGSRRSPRCGSARAASTSTANSSS